METCKNTGLPYAKLQGERENLILWIWSAGSRLQLNLLAPISDISHTYTHINKLQIALATLISHTRQMRVSLLTILPHHTAVIVGILAQKPFGIVVAVNVDFSQCIVRSWFLTAFVNSGFQPRKEELQPKQLNERLSWVSSETCPLRPVHCHLLERRVQTLQNAPCVRRGRAGLLIDSLSFPACKQQGVLSLNLCTTSALENT